MSIYEQSLAVQEVIKQGSCNPNKHRKNKSREVITAAEASPIDSIVKKLFKFIVFYYSFNPNSI
jgi:hypothetical protein